MQSLLLSPRRLVLQQCIPRLSLARAYRVKPGISLTAEERDDRLLKTLEAQLAEVKAKIKTEEAEMASIFKHTRGGGMDETENQTFLLWHKMLRPEEKKDLQKHGIDSPDSLYQAYSRAEFLLASPEKPSLEDLEPQLRAAHKMLATMPQRLEAKSRGPKKSAFISYRALRGFGYS